MMYLAKDNSHTPPPKDQVSAAMSLTLMVVEALFKEQYGMWIGIDQVCEIVGVRCPKVIRKYVRQGLLPQPNAAKKFSLPEVMEAVTVMRGERRTYPLSAKDKAQAKLLINEVREIYQIGR